MWSQADMQKYDEAEQDYNMLLKQRDNLLEENRVMLNILTSITLAWSTGRLFWDEGTEALKDLKEFMEGRDYD